MDQPPLGRQVDQSALMDGSLRTPELIGKGQLAVFALRTKRSNSRLWLIRGSCPAIPHAPDLHLGRYSVHASPYVAVRGRARN